MINRKDTEMKTRTNVNNVVMRTECALDWSPPSGGLDASILSINENVKQRRREVEYYGYENDIGEIV